MIIRRDLYLNQLINTKNNGIVKVITGIRRLDKSFYYSIYFIWIFNISGF